MCELYMEQKNSVYITGSDERLLNPSYIMQHAQILDELTPGHLNCNQLTISRAIIYQCSFTHHTKCA